MSPGCLTQADFKCSDNLYWRDRWPDGVRQYCCPRPKAILWLASNHAFESHSINFLCLSDSLNKHKICFRLGKLYCKVKHLELPPSFWSPSCKSLICHRDQMGGVVGHVGHMGHVMWLQDIFRISLSEDFRFCLHCL